jgi:hypothetical protein
VKRIHIVGCPRSGTTLAFEAIVNGFEIDGYASRERGILRSFRMPEDAHAIYCSKNPRDVLVAPSLLACEPDLYFVYLLRDPRDVVVSRHRQDPDRYWANLDVWRTRQRAAQRVWHHPRFVVVRYEDLVREPERVERLLLERMPFLVRKTPLRDFFRSATPSSQSDEALGGLRPLSETSIGAWRRHKPRLLAQMQRHGPLHEELIALGYEQDDAWLEELAGVEPDGQESHLPERRSLRARLRNSLRRRRQILKHRLRRSWR